MPKANYASGATGAITGAATGSAFGPVGTVTGAIVGGAAGLFGGKKKKKAKKRSTLDPQQQALYKDYVDSIRGEGPFKDMYNFDAQGYNDVFDKTVGRAANRNFNENIIPGITGQFRQNNLMNSSYTGEALGRAGRDVQENLDAQRSANVFAGQQQANQNKQNAINNIMGTQTFAYSKPGAEAPSGIDQVLGSLGTASGEWFADYLKKGNKPATAPAAPAVV
jgi:hypothetical protein